MSRPPVLPSYAEPGITRRADELGAVHFIGIGGAGMSGIALMMRSLGIEVSGSDSRESALLERLRAAGAQCFVGHDAAHLPEAARTVVVSSAIRPENPELVAAQDRGLLVLPRVQALAAVLADRKMVAVAGAHGKTSTTSMLVAALDACGQDPSYSIGGELTGTGRGAYIGSGEYAAVEADESDGSFLLLSPFAAIVTNIEADHLDNYGDFDGVLAAFDTFATTISGDGFLVACQDDPPAAALAARAADAGVQVITYGVNPDADLRISDLRVEADGTSYRTHGLGTDGLTLRISATGEHMALNSAAVLATGIQLGLDPQDLSTGLATFGGVHRRMDLKGEAGGVRVYDDYAHHPTEVRAQLTAARAVAGEGRLIVCFQPHLYSRTKSFSAEFAEALAIADVVLLMEVYAAREDPDPAVTSALIADQIPAGTDVIYEPNRGNVAPRLAELARPGDLVMTVGAGDVTEVGPLVLDQLQGR